MSTALSGNIKYQISNIKYQIGHWYYLCTAKASFAYWTLVLLVLFSVVTCYLLLVTLPTPIHAQDTGAPVSSSNYKAPQNADFTLQNIFHAILCNIAGLSPFGGCYGQSLDKNNRVVGYLYDRIPSGGAVGSLGGIVASLYTNPPTSTKEYLASVGQGFGLVKPAYAQVGGSGAGIINPVLSLWQVTRNLSYFLFIVVFIAVGLMIMFRAKINPQTVVSVQSALPGLVIGLVLVTFSYFITALLIDLSFVGIQLVTQLFLASGADNDFGNASTLASKSNIFSMWLSTLRFAGNFSDITLGVARTQIQAGGMAVLLPALLGAIVGAIVTLNPFGAGAGFVLGAGGPAVVIGLLVPVILVIALIIQFFKLLFKLLNAYLTLLVLAILAPLLILLGSIPGRGGSITFWWKSVLANSLIFPAVFAGFLFAGIILASPPQNWNASPPLFGNMSTELLRIIIAYGIILGLPAIPDMVKEALGVKDIKGIPQAALAGFSAGAGGLGYAGKRGYSMAMRGTGLGATREGFERKELEDATKAAGTPTTLRRMQKIARWMPKP